MMTMYDDAMRTIIDLPGEQLDALDAFCVREGISRAEAVRRAVAAHLKAQRHPSVRRAFGLWRDRPEDALDLEARLRADWQR
jgi:hypothetical protein